MDKSVHNCLIRLELAFSRGEKGNKDMGVAIAPKKLPVLCGHLRLLGGINDSGVAFSDSRSNNP